MKAPIDTATMRTGAASSFSISAAVSATMVSVVNPLAFSVAPTPRLSNVMHAIAGPLELGHLIHMPGAAGAPATRDEQDWITVAAVVEGQIHADDAT